MTTSNELMRERAEQFDAMQKYRIEIIRNCTEQHNRKVKDLNRDWAFACAVGLTIGVCIGLAIPLL